MPPPLDGSSPHEARWLGRLRLEIVSADGIARVAQRRHEGPLVIQRPFYPEGPEVVHLYLLHPPGGIVGGDRLETSIRVGPGAHALVTTPAAQKVYRSAGPEASQENALELASGAVLEWLPSEVIVFDRARATSTTRVSLADGAAFIGWEIGCLGRAECGEAFRSGSFAQHFELERGDRPLLVERFLARGGGAFLTASWGLRGLPVVATLLALARAPRDASALVDALRAKLPLEPALLGAATAVDEAVVVRVLGASVERVRAELVRAWSVLRPALLGREARPPRIWAT